MNEFSTEFSIIQKVDWSINQPIKKLWSVDWTEGGELQSCHLGHRFWTRRVSRRSTKSKAPYQLLDQTWSTCIGGYCHVGQDCDAKSRWLKMSRLFIRIYKPNINNPDREESILSRKGFVVLRGKKKKNKIKIHSNFCPSLRVQHLRISEVGN